MLGSNVAHARQVTQAAFAKGTVPAPYYLHLLMRAQGYRAQAVASGCAGPATAGGTVYCQRTAAQHKQPARGHGAQYGPTPTATRQVWRTILVPTNAPVHPNGSSKYPARKWRPVTTLAKQVVVA